jgi:phosphopantothenate-cysteine ligase
LDNFSAGTRGAISAEKFLSLGYAVIFLHRQYSLEPYSRHFESVLDLLKYNEKGQLAVDSAVKSIYDEHLSTKGSLLKVSFVSVNDYLFYLRAIANEMSALGANGMYYLAAAVSDFYVPAEKLVSQINSVRA